MLAWITTGKYKPTIVFQNVLFDRIPKADIDQLAGELAVLRDYPEALSRLVIERARL